MSISDLQTKLDFEQEKFDGHSFLRFLLLMPAKEKPIYFTPTPQTESVIATIRKTSKAGKGPIVRAAMDYVATQIKAGKLEFAEHQLLAK